MATNPRNSDGAARRKLKRRMRAERNPCHLCGFDIDWDARYPHPQSFVVDEGCPVKRWREGGYSSPTACATDPANTFPAHACCNSWRGCKPLTPRLRASIRSRYAKEFLNRGIYPKSEALAVDRPFM